MGARKNFIIGSFTLSKEHVELSLIAGVDPYELVDEYLTNLELDLKLKPQSLVVYFRENRGDYFEYYYTEDSNKKFISKFEESIFSFTKQTDFTLN